MRSLCAFLSSESNPRACRSAQRCLIGNNNIDHKDSDDIDDYNRNNINSNYYNNSNSGSNNNNGNSNNKKVEVFGPARIASPLYTRVDTRYIVSLNAKLC